MIRSITPRAFLLTAALLGCLTTVKAEGLEPPQTFSMNTTTCLDGWKVDDTNHDENTFSYYNYSNGVRLPKTNGNNDDWLISPSITLKAGSTYLIIYKLSNTYSRDNVHSFSVAVGNSQEVSAMTNVIGSKDDFNSYSATDVKFEFVPQSAGDYFFGLHVTTPASVNLDFYCKEVKIEEYIIAPGAVTDLAATPGESGALSATLTWKWPVKSDQNTEEFEITGANIYRGDSRYFTVSDENKVGTINGNYTKGEECSWTDNTVTQAGNYNYKVVPFNAKGVSTSYVTGSYQIWIGPDSGLAAVKNVVAKVSEDNAKTILLTFDEPKGTNGGYVDLTGVTYKIVRKNSKSETTDLETSWSGTQPYRDNTLPGLDVYSYVVYNVSNGETATTGSESNKVAAGGVASLPWSEDFSNSATFDLMTLFRDNESRYDWKRYTSGSSIQCLAFYGSGSEVDSYVATPGFRLEKGKAYRFKFNSSIKSYGASNAKNIQLYLATGPEVSKLGNKLWEEKVDYTTTKNQDIVFHVEETGDYNLVFRCYGIANSTEVLIDDLSLTETPVAPNPVTELTAEADANGALEVALTFTAPSTDNTGNALEKVEKIVVKRTNTDKSVTTAATFSDKTAGRAVSFKDVVEESGVYTYEVIPYAGENAGESVTVTTAFVGKDAPKDPATVTATGNADGSATVSFSAVTEGEHGGYIGQLHYVIYRNGQVIADDVTETTYTDNADVEYHSYKYAVAASYDDITGKSRESRGVIRGEKVNLPFTADFTDNNESARWKFEKDPNGYGSTWSYNSSKKALSVQSSKNAHAFTPPFDAVAGTLDVSYEASAYSSIYPSSVKVMLCRQANAAEPDMVATSEAKEFNSSTATKATEALTVPEAGRYVLAVVNPKNGYYTYLHKVEISQKNIGTGVEAIAGDKSLRYDNADQTVISGSEEWVLKVYSAAGSLVAFGSNTVSTADLPAGIYIAVAISGDGHSESIRFVK